MGDAKKMKIHLASSLDELKKFGTLPNVDQKNLKIQVALKTAEKLLLQARTYETQRDEENAYVLYLRYCELVRMIRNLKEYKENSSHFDKLLGKANFKKAYNALVLLDESLGKRYKDLQEENDIIKKMEQLDMLDAVKPQSKAAILQEKISGLPVGGGSNGLATNGTGFNEMKKNNETVITSHSLHSLMIEKCTSFLIFDVRPSADFQSSHINHSNCYSIPEEAIKPGLTAWLLQRALPENTKYIWDKRKKVDRIIFVDWDSPGDSPSPAIKNLMDILIKWDNQPSSQTRLQVLHLGYEDWAMRFPFVTTNPKVKKRPKPATLNSSFSQMIAEVEYPSLDDSDSFEEQKQVPKIPDVNRSAKPNAIIQKTLDRDTKPIPGAVTVSFQPRFSDSSEVLTSGSPNVPFVDVAPREAVKKPTIDRSTKAKALMKGQNRKDLLEAQNLLLDDNLEEEKKRLEMEKEWELLRLKKEGEIEVELRQELQERHEELMDRIKMLDEERNKKDEENQRLRVQLESLKNKFRDLKPVVASPIEDNEKRLEDAIKEKEKEEARIKHEVDRLRAERKKKEDEERKKQLNGLGKKDLGLDRIRDVPAEPAESDVRSRKVDTVESRVRPATDYPTINRLNKPSVPTVRNSIITPEGSGLTGLKNLGNTCYMNSVLQCLTHIGHLKTYFLDGEFRNCLNGNSRTRGHIAEKFANVYERLWSGQNRSFACTEFKSTVGQYRPDWAGRDQQDADDFLVFLLDCLHEDLNRIKRKQPLKEQENDGKSDSEASRVALADWQMSNQSKISDLFYGQEKSTLTCETCGHSSVRFDMICTLVVPIPPSVRHCELDDCLSLYTKGESIPDWNCSKCKQPREAVKKLDLYRTPKILVITLKRFLREGYDYWKKRQTIVDYPLDNLRVNGSSYKLIAVINHYGTLDGGHYTASAYHPDMNEWYKFDDSDVTPISANDAVVSAAYILFYSKIN